MAQVLTQNTGKIWSVKKWLGLNEAQGGDTVLAMGESSVMRNFRITREGHLQVRPGYSCVCTLQENSPVRGVWYGWVDGVPRLLAACAGQLWLVDTEHSAAAPLGAIHDGPTHFFGFARKVYLLTGREYYCWDGTGAVTPVEGYVPTVSVAAQPEGGGTLLEGVNLLCGKRRMGFSPDGTATVFHLPEQDVDEILAVEGTAIGWTADLAAGTLSFETAPEEGVNTLFVTWRKGQGEREKVCAMRFAEIYNGAADTRVFLYGDGTNTCIYSDLDGDGLATAEYFPDLNTLSVDSENTPITAMARHYDRLMVYKSDSAYCVEDMLLEVDTGARIAAFTCLPVNRSVGSAAWGPAPLVDNSPITLHGQGVYRWSLSSSGSRDERNAKRISSRVEVTMAGFPPEECVTFDDGEGQQFFIFCKGEALVHCYANDTWYRYTDLPVACMTSVQGQLYFGTPDGRLMHFGREWHSDDGAPIDACWESGAMDFGADFLRKYSPHLWVAVQPESRSRVSVSVQSDRRGGYPAGEIVYSFATFANADFAHFSFNTGRKPKVVRLGLRVKKFTYYKLIFRSCSATETATVLAADVAVRDMGRVK